MASVVIKYCDDCHGKSESDGDTRDYLHGVEVVEKQCHLCCLLTLCCLLQKLQLLPGLPWANTSHPSTCLLDTWIWVCHGHFDLSMFSTEFTVFPFKPSFLLVVFTTSVDDIVIHPLFRPEIWKSSWIPPFPRSPGWLFPRCCCF